MHPFLFQTYLWFCPNTSGTHLLPQTGGKVFKCAFPVHTSQYMLSFLCMRRVITLIHMTDRISIEFWLNPESPPFTCINLKIKKVGNGCRNAFKIKIISLYFTLEKRVKMFLVQSFFSIYVVLICSRTACFCNVQ